MTRYLVLLVALVWVSDLRADIIIDNFASAQSLVTNDQDANQSGPNAGVFGAYREMILKLYPPSEELAVAQVISSKNRLSLNNPDDVKSTLEVRYDGSSFGGDYNPNGVSAVNVTEGGANLGILFSARNDFGSVTNGIGATVTFTLSSGENNSSTAEVTLIESGNDFVTYFVPFLAFVGNVDLTNVTGIKMFVDSRNDFAQDVVFTQFVFSTPAPPGLILGLIALAVGLLYVWRTRRTVSPVAVV